LLESLARRYGIELNQTTSDLIVQQLNASPLFITEFMRAARATQTSLTTYLACQRLYVDELLGGGIKRHFDRILQTISPAPQTNRTLLRVLYESAMSDTGKASLWAWKKRLAWRHPNLSTSSTRCTSMNWSIQPQPSSRSIRNRMSGWTICAHYRVEVETEPRAKVVAETLLEALKRAPQTMNRKYRREAAVGLPVCCRSSIVKACRPLCFTTTGLPPPTRRGRGAIDEGLMLKPI
jgi:hypothetical protein